MDVKTLLNRCHHFKSFVYGEISLRDDCVHVNIRARKGRRGFARNACAVGDVRTARAPRSFQFVPLWVRGAALVLHQAYRLPRCGVTVELLPWATASIAPATPSGCSWRAGHDGSRGARLPRYSEPTGAWFIALSGGWSTGPRPPRSRRVKAIASMRSPVEGPQVPHGRLPDRPRASPPAVGRSRTDRGGFRGFFQTFGKVRAEKLQFVASDMWKPYIKLIAEFAGQAIHVLDASTSSPR